MNASDLIAEEEKEVHNINHSEDGQHFDLDSLPPGYRFCPTDVDLLFYLSKKVHHQPLPPNKIAQVNLYAHHPDQLAAMFKAEGENEWFYFTPRERKYTNGRRPKRSIGDRQGYWKATGAEKEIKSVDGRKIGYKRALVFYQGSHHEGVKTKWIMHEFRVADIVNDGTDHVNVNEKRFDDYVLCRVYKKRSQDDEPKNINDTASTSTSSMIQRSPDEAENLQLIEENRYNPTSLYNTHQRLQNQHDHQQQGQQQPIVEMPEIPSAYDPVFIQNDLQVVVPHAGGVDDLWHTQNNSSMMDLWSTDLYGLEDMNNPSSHNIMPGGGDHAVGGNMGNSDLEYHSSTTAPTPTPTPTPTPWDSLNQGYVSTSGDMWGNTYQQCQNRFNYYTSNANG